MKLTEAQRRGLRLLVEAGSGVVQKNGTVLCAGETGDEGDGPVHSVTWLRLVAMNLVTGTGSRLMPTSLGVSLVKDK